MRTHLRLPTPSPVLDMYDRRCRSGQTGVLCRCLYLSSHVSIFLVQAPVNQAVPIAANNSMPGSSVAMGMGGLPGGQKHGGNVYENADRDGYYKRPRVEDYSNALTADVDSYRKQHEVSALVSFFPELKFTVY